MEKRALKTAVSMKEKLDNRKVVGQSSVAYSFMYTYNSLKLLNFAQVSPAQHRFDLQIFLKIEKKESNYKYGIIFVLKSTKVIKNSSFKRLFRKKTFGLLSKQPVSKG